MHDKNNNNSRKHDVHDNTSAPAICRHSGLLEDQNNSLEEYVRTYPSFLSFMAMIPSGGR